MAPSKLVKIVSSVMPLHTHVLEPAQKVEIVYQQAFDFYKNHASHISLGNFYEYMTQGLWGGKLRNHLLLKNGDSEKQEQLAIHKFTKPDLVHEVKKQIGESKACHSGESLNLYDEQMARYKFLQLQKQDAHIYFAIYRHKFPKIKSFQGTEEQLFAKLTSSAYHSVVLPLSIIMELHETMDSTLVYRYDGQRFDRCTCVRSQTLNRFLIEPEEVIDELDLNVDDFEIKRFISSKRFKLGVYKIQQFPILRIFDVNHEAWIKDFNSKVKDDKIVPDLLDEYYEEHHPEEYDPRQDGCSDVDETSGELGNINKIDLEDDDEIPF